MWLNGVSLEDLNSHIRIVDIIEHPPKRAILTADRAKYHGLHYLGTIVEERVIEVQFTINAKDMSVRRTLLDMVLSSFDQNGQLELPNRDDMYINVVCTEAPGADSLRDYMNVLTLEYTSFDPFWHSSDPVEATKNLVATVQGTVGITPDGNVSPTFLEFTLLNTSGSTLNDFEISVNGYSFVFASLGLADGSTLTCEYDDDTGFLEFKIGATSVNAKRTGDDDLLMNAQAVNTVTATADKASTLTLYARGHWK